MTPMKLKGMKIHTKRHGRENPVEDARIMQKTINRLRGAALVPKGVQRFKSHQEADEWMTKMIASTRARRKLKTS